MSKPYFFELEKYRREKSDFTWRTDGAPPEGADYDWGELGARSEVAMSHLRESVANRQITRTFHALRNIQLAIHLMEQDLAARLPEDRRVQPRPRPPAPARGNVAPPSPAPAYGAAAGAGVVTPTPNVSPTPTGAATGAGIVTPTPCREIPLGRVEPKPKPILCRAFYNVDNMDKKRMGIWNSTWKSTEEQVQGRSRFRGWVGDHFTIDAATGAATGAYVDQARDNMSWFPAAHKEEAPPYVFDETMQCIFNPAWQDTLVRELETYMRDNTRRMSYCSQGQTDIFNHYYKDTWL